MAIKIIFGVLATILSAIAYRAGGMGTEDTAKPEWIPKWLRKSWIRDWLCPAFVYGCLLSSWSPSLWWEWLLLILCYPLLGACLSTYWDWLFGFDNFWFAGFMCGIAAFPLIFCGYAWWLILARAILLAILWGGWSLLWTEVEYEEMGRGAFLVATVPLLLI